MCSGWCRLQLSQGHSPCQELGLGAAADQQGEQLGMATGRRWLWIRSVSLNCQHVGGAGMGSCHAGNLVQPSPRLLPFS